MKKIIVLAALGLSLVACNSGGQLHQPGEPPLLNPGDNTASCVPPPTPGPFPLAVFDTEDVKGSAYIGFTSCGLSIVSEVSEKFYAAKVSKISIKTDGKEIPLKIFPNPEDLNRLVIEPPIIYLPNYTSIYGNFKLGTAKLIIYTKDNKENIATTMCGDVECGKQSGL